MKFEMPKLEYPEDGLVPYISKQIVQYHYGVHTKKYYDVVNKLTKDTLFSEFDSLEECITKLVHADTVLFNNACQAFNHTFYWNSLCPASQSDKIPDKLHDVIVDTFGSIDHFKDKFSESFMDGFGSTWTWLVLRHNELRVITTPNAGTPITTPNQIPLLVIDGWEHSWYLQYPADKQGYINAIWNIINWDTINDRYNKAVQVK